MSLNKLDIALTRWEQQTDFRAKAESEADQNVSEADYTEKYSLTLAPTEFQQKYGKNAILVIEYQFKQVLGSTFAVQTKVDGADAKETTGISGLTLQRHIHTDIVDFSVSRTVSLEAKRTGGVDEGVLEFFHAYLQIGNSSTSVWKIMLKITGLRSRWLQITDLWFGSWTKSTNNVTLEVYGDYDNISGEATLTGGTGSNMYMGESGIKGTIIADFLAFRGVCALATNPMTIDKLHIRRMR
jgi:hypothetical protein